MLISIKELEGRRSRDLIPCKCHQCKQTFVVTKNLAQRALKGTKKVLFCSTRCRSISRTLPSVKKTCICCQKFFYTTYKGQKFCSQICGRSYYNTLRHESCRLKASPCLNCKKPTKHWGNRFCTKKCVHDYVRNKNLLDWQGGRNKGLTSLGCLPVFIRDYIWSKYHNACAECRWKKINPSINKSPLQIHHIDGDAHNNKENNLILLCPNCHALTKNFGSLNKTSARNRRYAFD